MLGQSLTAADDQFPGPEGLYIDQPDQITYRYNPSIKICKSDMGYNICIYVCICMCIYAYTHLYHVYHGEELTRMNQRSQHIFLNIDIMYVCIYI